MLLQRQNPGTLSYCSERERLGTENPLRGAGDGLSLVCADSERGNYSTWGKQCV